MRIIANVSNKPYIKKITKNKRMSKLKRFTDIMKGLLAIGVIVGSVPFIIYPVIWYWIKCFNIFF